MKKLTILTLICFFSVSSIVLAKGPCDKQEWNLPHGKWWQIPEVKEKLRLTIEEQQELDDLSIQRRRQMIDLKNNLQKEKLELEVILDQENFDESACINQFKKCQDARTKVTSERFKFLARVRKLLGRDRYRQLKTEFRDHRMHKMKGRHGPVGCIKGEGVNR